MYEFIFAGTGLSFMIVPKMLLHLYNSICTAERDNKKIIRQQGSNLRPPGPRAGRSTTELCRITI